jgi:hypothetical protein
MARIGDYLYEDECDLKWEALLFKQSSGSLATLNTANITVDYTQNARVVTANYSYPLKLDPLLSKENETDSIISTT